MNSGRFIGVDLLQHVPFIETTEKDSLVRTKTMDFPQRLPAAVLPHYRQEQPIYGESALLHRRGTGMPWPPECQVSKEQAKTGAGRVPLNAAFARLCETGWKSQREPFAWRPDQDRIGLQSADLVAGSAIAFGNPKAADDIVLVVPNRLPDSALQLLSTALQKQRTSGAKQENTVLLWRSVAIALNWCVGQEPQYESQILTEGEERKIGHILVASLGLDAGELSSCPIILKRVGGRNRLIPVVDRNEPSVPIAPPGVGLFALTTKMNSLQAIWQTMAGPDWIGEAVASNSHVPQSERLAYEAKRLPGTAGGAIHPRNQEETLGEWLVPTAKKYYDLCEDWLVGSGEKEKLNYAAFILDLAEEQKRQSIGLSREYGRLLGTIIHGSAGELKTSERLTFAARLRTVLQSDPKTNKPVVLVGPASAAQGAIEFLRRRNAGVPPYYENLVPLHLHHQIETYQGISNEYLPVIEGQLVEGGQDLEIQHGVRDLNVRKNADQLQLILRSGSGIRQRFDFKRTITKLKRTAETDEPVNLSVVVRPGQGYPEVKVATRRTNLLNAHLDWERMSQTQEPQEIAGYLDETWTVDSDSTLWWQAKPKVDTLLEKFEHAGEPTVHSRPLFEALQEFRDDYLNTRKRAENQEFTYEALYGLEDIWKPAERKLSRLSEFIGLWWSKQSLLSNAFKEEIVRSSGWMYNAAPGAIVEHSRRVLKSYIAGGSEPGGTTELTVIGNCFKSSDDIRLFFVAGRKRLNRSFDKTNNWLRAMRYIIQYRDQALSRDAIDSATLSKITEAIVTKLAQEYSRVRAREQQAYYIFQNCLTITIFLLKRRRWDHRFLTPEASDETYTLLKNTLSDIAREQPTLNGLNRNQIRWAGIVLAFLEQRATQADRSEFLSIFEAMD